mmetsp:Transcript_38955/g.101973  ORF Transcript_38955/g.101973 Transcript_38955/m.101973 type:complete len:243 (+) Transcript_38955:1219-1947(+)
MDTGGEDTEGRQYDNPSTMWKQQLEEQGGESKWYAKAYDFWAKQEASVSGVLGGYSATNEPDLSESLQFLDLLGRITSPPTFGSVLDAGAGIGRITQGCLLKKFESVDLVESDARYVETAKKNLAGTGAANFFCAPIQAFSFAGRSYDVIWNQWVLLYLTDDHLVSYLQRCRSALRPDGVICVKENVVLKGNFVVDNDDNSITRTDGHYKEIFKQAGLQLILEKRQLRWPTDLFPVMMYALR